MDLSFFIAPTLPSGTYILSVHTDYRNQVFELDSDDNNMRSVLFTIRQRSPDLIVRNFTFVVEPTIRGNVLRCSYMIENVGTGATIGAPWFDQLRITPYSVGNSGGLVLRDTRHLSELPVGHNYSENILLSLLPRVFGNMYLRLMVDARSQIVEENKMNNLIIRPATIAPLYPDLAVQNLSLVDSSSIVGGQSISLEWSVVNEGEVIIESLSWYDSIFLNSTRTLDKLADISISNGNMLAPQMTYHQRSTITLPLILDYSLTYNIMLRVNSRGHFSENDQLGNNVGRIAAVISPPPSPDLQVTRLSYAYFPPSRVLRAQWTVHNVGNSMRSAMSWTDQVFLSPLQTFFNPAGAIILGQRVQSLRLQADQVYTIGDSFFVPSTIFGEFYLYIVTDISSSVMEIDGEDNNALRSDTTLTVAQVPSVTLNVGVNINILPASYSTGQTFVLEYSVINSRDVALGATSWVDAVYLSNVANPSRSYLLDDAYLLTQTVNSMQLDQSSTYTVMLNITLPYHITGQQFLAVLLDMNNVLDIRTTGTFGTIISIELGSLPDLTVSAISRDLNITSGQPAVIDYSVRNEGETEARGRWYEVLILSQDAEIDSFDTRLRTVSNPQTGFLRVNESYNQSVEVFIPFDLPTSFYYIFVIVDTRNDLHEEQVDNNEDHFVVFVMETVSTDLSILDVQVSPARVTYKGSLNFRWRLRNNGSLQARGYKCDSIYLSEDSMWDISDHELGLPRCSAITVDAFSNNVRNDRIYSRPAIAPFIAQQEYYGLVRTRTNIRDPNLSNNIGSSSSLIEINAPSITLDRLTTVTLDQNDVQVFRIQGIPGDETLVATLTTEQYHVYHDLFLRYKQAPTGAEHDAFSQFPRSFNQRAVVRHSKSGSYYLRVESFTNRGTTSRYNVEILVKIARFEILSIKPVIAAPLGNVTIKMAGTVLSYFSSASLVSLSRNMTYQSSKVYWFTSVSVYATFDLSGAEHGNYSVRLTNEKTGSIAQLNNSFTVATGIPGRLAVNVQSPRRLRPGETGDIVVHLRNFGNTDLLTPHLVLVSRDQTHFRLLDDFGPTGFSEQIDFLGLPLEGPGGILPPETSTQVVFRAAQTTQGINRARFTIKTENNGSAPHAFLDKKFSLRPNFVYSYEIWDTIWANFIRSVGTTQQSFHQRLSELATEFSLVGKRAYSVQELVEYQLQVAYGLLSGKIFIIIVVVAFIVILVVMILQEIY